MPSLPVRIFILLALSVSAVQAQISDAIEPQEEMTFQLDLDDRNGAHPQVGLLGRGRITSRTPARFKAAARNLPPGSVVYLDSAGGSLLPAMALGTSIRDHLLTVEIADGARCTSACAYAFLGGVIRLVHPDGALGLHRPFLAHRSTGARISNDTKIDIDEMDELLRGYVAALNVDPRIVTRAQGINPNEMWYPTREELEEFNLTTSQ